jgi:hypothetical protein
MALLIYACAFIQYNIRNQHEHHSKYRVEHSSGGSLTDGNSAETAVNCVYVVSDLPLA